jgi:hypothetical protein
LEGNELLFTFFALIGDLNRNSVTISEKNLETSFQLIFIPVLTNVNLGSSMGKNGVSLPNEPP